MSANGDTSGATTIKPGSTVDFSAATDGKVEKGNTDLVSGDTVNTAINSAIDNAGKTTDNKLALKANVAAASACIVIRPMRLRKMVMTS